MSDKIVFAPEVGELLTRTRGIHVRYPENEETSFSLPWASSSRRHSLWRSVIPAASPSQHRIPVPEYNWADLTSIEVAFLARFFCPQSFSWRFYLYSLRVRPGPSLSETMYLLIIFHKSFPPQNRQLNNLLSNSKQ